MNYEMQETLQAFKSLLRPLLEKLERLEEKLDKLEGSLGREKSVDLPRPYASNPPPIPTTLAQFQAFVAALEKGQPQTLVCQTPNEAKAFRRKLYRSKGASKYTVKVKGTTLVGIPSFPEQAQTRVQAPKKGLELPTPTFLSAYASDPDYHRPGFSLDAWRLHVDREAAKHQALIEAARQCGITLEEKDTYTYPYPPKGTFPELDAALWPDTDPYSGTMDPNPDVAYWDPNGELYPYLPA